MRRKQGEQVQSWHVCGAVLPPRHDSVAAGIRT